MTSMKITEEIDIVMTEKDVLDAINNVLYRLGYKVENIPGLQALAFKAKRIDNLIKFREGFNEKMKDNRPPQPLFPHCPPPVIWKESDFKQIPPGTIIC